MTRLFREAYRYAAVSLVSLGVDTAILALLVRILKWGVLTSATISFLVGACIAYALSVKFVFRLHRLRNRRAEFAGFVALGLIGLAVNTGVIYLATRFLGMHVLIAKGVAAGCSFSCNFLARRQLLFVPAAPERAAG
jgi:putative flippase GtrA